MPQPAPLPVEIAQVGETTVVSFTCDALEDEQVIRGIGERLARLIQPGCRHFILNFGPVRTMASLMLAKLVGFQKKIVTAGAGLTLCAVGPELYGLFEWTQLNKIFTITGDMPEGEWSEPAAAPPGTSTGCPGSP